MNQEELDVARRLAALSAAGGLSGLLALIATAEVLTLRKLIGRSGSAACLGAGAAAIWIPYPSAEFIAALGMSFFLGGVGAQLLEKMIANYLVKKLKEKES